MKVDLHVHSDYSDHSTATLDQIISKCLASGIGCIAVTDHTTVEGGTRLKEIAPFKVIVGHEVLTREGEITGLFVCETLEPNRPLGDTVAEIKSQGGLVYVPHPCERLRFKPPLRLAALVEVIDHVDIVEVFNARATLSRFNKAAEELARSWGIPGAAGSDAHSADEIGMAYVEMHDWLTSGDFLAALMAGRIEGAYSGWRVHARTVALKLRKRITRGASRGPSSLVGRKPRKKHGV
jgi:predicted metal-dependent phosphoesterase TrpH